MLLIGIIPALMICFDGFIGFLTVRLWNKQRGKNQL